MLIEELLEEAVSKGASDIHISSNLPPVFRIDGQLIRTSLPPLTSDNVETLVFPILNNEQRRRLEQDWELDMSYGIHGIGRFRVNIYKNRGNFAAAFRTINTEVPSFKTLGLPEIVRKITEKPRGLILVTGPTGSGKSTTLASMIDYINENRNEHILTIEDPIEFLHKSKKSVVHQRELGQDTRSFSNALRAALREDPDIILVGELRDLETISLAITAAETAATGIIKVDACAHTIVEPVVASTAFLYDGRTDAFNRTISLDGIHTTNVDTILTSSGADMISIKDIHMYNAQSLCEVSKSGSSISINGSIVLEGEDIETKVPVFGSLAGNIILNTIPMFNTGRYMERTASNKKYTGTLYDTIGPHGRLVIQTSATTSLSVTTIGNAIYEFTGTGVNLSDITGGIEGQLLILKFKNAAKIYNSGTIALNDAITQTPISINKGGTVMFKCRQGKFVQI